MEILSNLDLLSVGIAIAGTVILGCAVYFNNRTSITNKTFLLFTIITAAWGLLNYFSYKITNVDLAFILLRIEISIAVWHSFFIFKLFSVFPKEKYSFSKIYYFITLPLTAIISLLALTPYVFESVASTKEGFIETLNPGPAISIFGMYVIGIVMLAFIILVKKIVVSSGEDRNNLVSFFIGALLMFIPILVLIFIFPAALDDPSFVPFGGLFIFPFIVFVAYAILKHKLFNLKVAGSAFLIFVLSITALGEIIFAEELSLLIYRSSIFILILLFGVMLIKGVLKEVHQREQIQKLAGELEIANREQQNLIHFITHQVKGFITKSRNIFAGIKEEDYGPVSEEIKPLIEEGFRSDTEAVETVQEILQASNLRKGTVELKKQEVDLKYLVQNEIEKQTETAKNKGLELHNNISSEDIKITGDKDQLVHVIHNLIDNSIKYTLKGSVTVSLNKTNNKIRFSVKDTGVGITDEDKKRLFTEGGRGKDSVKVNVDSTGYGLFIVKNIVEKHNGKVWAESEGPGKGSEFIVEFPAKSIS